MARVMVLAAGLGTRLRPLTEHVPKPLVPLGDRPLVAQVLLLLSEQGERSVVLNTHHISQAFDVLQMPGMELHLSHEPEILGSAGGVRAARAHLQSPCVVWNGDIWTRAQLAPLFEAAAREPACLLVAPAKGAGSVGLDDSGRVVRLRGERFGHEVRAADYVGIMALGQAALPQLPERGCLIGDLCLPLLRSGASLATRWHSEPWYDVGSFEGYLAANRNWLGERRYWVASNARVDEGVVCDGSVVGEGARVQGQGALSGCVVWPGARAVAPLRDSVVYGDDAVVRVDLR